MKFILILTALAVVALAAPALALDPPHNESVACNNCHNNYGLARDNGGNIDNTSMNMLCIDCHSVPGGHLPKDTHSAYTTDSAATYGEAWLTECIDCHNPHYQEQFRVYRSAYPGGSFLYTGTVTGTGTNGGVLNVVNVAGQAECASDGCKGMMFLPNTRYPYYYRIVNSTATSVTTYSPVATGRRGIAAGNTYAMGYGKLIRSEVRVSRPVANSSGVVFESTILRPVMYFNSAGPHSPAASLNDTAAMCIVCHTRTKSNNYGYAKYGQAFDTTVADYVNQAHKDRSSMNQSCWANTAGCHNLPETGFDANCAGCHGQPPENAATMVVLPVTSGRDSQGGAGAHMNHVAKGITDCNYCHTGGGSAQTPSHPDNDPYGMSFGFTHGLTQGTYTGPAFSFANATFNLVSGDGTTVVGTTANRLCSNIYCHSDGNGTAFRTVDWDNGIGNLNCTSCHGNTVDQSVVTNAHPTHVTGNYGFACNKCHSLTVDIANTTSPTYHVNAAKDVSFADGGAAYETAGANTCSSIYCHSNGQGGAPLGGNPVWTGFGYTCTNCHDTAGAATALSAAHKNHTGGGAATYGCVDCHADVVSDNSTITNFSYHVNGIKNVTVNASHNGDAASYSGGSCATINCHGSNSPAWTATTSNNSCTKCHGEGAASPTEAQKAPGGAGTDTSGINNAATDAQVGAHQAHLNPSAYNNYTAPIACATCHNVPAVVTSAGHIDNSLPAEVYLVGLATNGGVNTGVTYSGGQCNNVYCHGNGMPYASDPGIGNTPTWNDPSYLTAIPNITGGDCDKCHNSPPTGYAGNSHTGSETLANCNGCHDHVAVGGTFSNTLLHANGSIEASGCTGCHGQPPVDAGTMVSSPATTGRATSGAHSYHWAKYSAQGCSTCHNTGGAGGHTSSYRITMGFTYGQTQGTYNYPALSNGFDVENDGTTAISNNVSGARECTNIYCHSDGGNYAASFSYSTISWDGSLDIAGKTDCDKCHGNGAGTLVTTNVHPKHVTTYGLACVTCHAGTVDGANNLIGNHVNAQKNVFFSGAMATGTDYTGRPNCTTSNCHSNGLGGAPNVTPAWNSVAGLSCTGCHNNNEGSGSQMASGAHAAHINTTSAGTALGRILGCVDCHAGTVSNDSTISVIANHVDGTKDILVNIDGTTCSNIQCHSDGNFEASMANTVFNNPTWATGSLGCVDCHGDGATKAYPTYANGGVGDTNSNSHSAHVATSSLTCNECHATTSTAGTSIDGTTPANHVNQTVNVAFDQGGTYTDGAETCNATYCHGSGNSPNWGTAGPLACDSCHAANNTIGGKHGVHYSVATVATDRTAANGSTSSNYVFNCGVCHDNTAHATGMADAPNHVTANVVFNATIAGAGTYVNGVTNSVDADGFEYTTNGTCSTTYCHSKGEGTAGNVTPAWDGAVMTCNSCHDSAPATNAHNKHHTTGTVMTGKDCDACHDATATGSTAIANSAMHVNGTPNVVLNATFGGTFAAGGCTSVYCHSDGAGGAPNTAVSDWTATTLPANCTGCHNNNEGTGSQMASGAHAAHINTTSAGAALGRTLGCVDCHAGTVSADQTIGTIANHIDGGVDILVNIDGTTCSNIQCHSDGNFDGSVANTVFNNPTWATGSIGCVDCHGDAATKAYPTYTNGGAGAYNSNSHTAHVATSSLTCNECHATTSTAGTSIDGTTPANHVNQTVDMAFNLGGTYNGVAETCNATYCHGLGDSPNWGTSGPLACNTCHAANNTLPGSHAVHYSSATVATDRSAANGSTSGSYIFSCGVCHDGTTHAGGMADAGNHVTANVIFNATIAGAGTHIANATWGTDAQGFEWTQAECSATYCHSQGGSNTTPQWGVDTMTCGSCHQASPTTNSHADHLTAGVMITGVACDACHDATVTGSSAIANKAMHVNGAKNVILNSTYGGSFATNQCSTVYCHSDGQSTASYATPTWGGAAATCTSCHGNAAGVGGAGTNLSASHAEHVGTFGYDCNACHNGTVDNATTINAGKIANHVNGSPTVLTNSTFGGSYGSGTCSTVVCHGSVTQVTWAAGGTTGNCSLCHGMAASASDGRDTNGNTLASDVQVGAHVAHLTNSTFISGPIACSQCHEDYTGGATYYDKVMAANHLDGGGADFQWGALATNGGSLSPSYAGGVCSNTYCHGSQMPVGSSSGADTTPVWNAVGYLTGSYNNDCGQCHGFPPTDNASHSAMTLGDGTNCYQCHSHLYAAGDATESGWVANGTAFSNALLHIDGTLQAAGACDSCHGYPPVIGDGKTYRGSALEGKGAHPQHVTHLATLNSITLDPANDAFTDASVAQTCGVCHDTSTTANHMNGSDNDVNRDMLIPVFYQFGASAPSYGGAPATSSGTQMKSCSNVSCHFQESPGWQDPATAGN